MFTGIIQHLGRIEALERRKEDGRLRVCALPLADRITIGASVAVNGCCLTVVEAKNGVLCADLSGETLRRTAFGEMNPGRLVNLEQPLTAGGELGGHFVQGHVDGIGRVTQITQQGENWWLAVRVPQDLARYVATKGSLAIDGISLTVAAWRDEIADFAIIPFTHSHTNVRELAVGDAVNLECDILAKYVERLLEAKRQPTPSRLTLSRLIEEGF